MRCWVQNLIVDRTVEIGDSPQAQNSPHLQESIVVGEENLDSGDCRWRQRPEAESIVDCAKNDDAFLKLNWKRIKVPLNAGGICSRGSIEGSEKGNAKAVVTVIISDHTFGGFPG